MRKLRKAAISTICIAEALLVMGGATACAVRNDSMTPTPPNAAQQQTVQQTETTVPQQVETQPQTAQQVETQQPDANQLPADSAINVAEPNAAQQTTAQPNTTQQPNATAQPVGQQNANQPAPSANDRISVDDAKNAALTDAGVTAADVVYTKEKLDYEDGIAVYDIEFYVGNTEYEYEINATTGAVYSKSVETHYDHTGHEHQRNAVTTGTDISAEGAKAIALNHAGFTEADVSRLKAEFDIDDGLSVYEVEFVKDGREYEYKINTANGEILEYDID